ncbi:phosphoribosyltransferase [Beijerinckia sp. L45]|uniref:phosphoribosyltransferase n=1 Tax=Beijerinckia sp. L45 TaxID=1641855 RepID=UPI00131E39FE|nr:phosphoribosyltransferase [Beijerinckia sp. L45]
MTRSNHTEPTTHFWQQFHDHLPAVETQAPYRFAFPVQLPDGRWLKLPIRQRADDSERAVASFIANHAAFTVIDALAGHMVAQVRDLAVDVVVGLPTLGLALAPPIARALGQDRFVPFGTSRKFWYDDAFSAQAASITTTAVRPIYVDPNLIPLLAGRRVLLVDDTISSGATAVAALAVLRAAGAVVVGLAFAMSQGQHWRGLLAAQAPDALEKVSFVFQSPHLAFSRADDGWIPVAPR